MPKQRLGELYLSWNAQHLATELFAGLDADIRVFDDTIMATYYNARELECLRPHYEGLAKKLANENIDPRVSWLYDFKLDFRFH